MIQSSSILNAISNAAHSAIHNAAFYTKKVCVDSKVDTLFHTTMGAIRAHPYIATLGATLGAIIGVYCCRGQISILVDKVKQAVDFLSTKTKASLRSVINLFKQNPAPVETTTTGSDLPAESAN